MTSLAKNLLTRIFRRPETHRPATGNRFRPSFVTLEDRTVPSGSDLFGSATVLTGAFDSDTGNNSTATGEPGEVGIMGDPTIHSIWWQWTAPASGMVDINTFESSFDTKLGVYTGSSVDALTIVAENDDADSLQSQVLFQAVGGTTYYIAVDGFSDPAFNIDETGDVILRLGMAQTNDNFSNAIAIAGGTVTSTNGASTGETGEPVHGPNNTVTNSVWYSWTATATGSTEINTFGSNFDTLLAVYTGTSVNNLTTIATNDDAGASLQSQVIFNAQAGTTYMIAVDGSLNETGTFVLTLPDAPTSSNNPPVINAQSFSVNENSTGGTVVGTVVATDPDAGQTLHYTITGGNTGGTFSINFTTGVIQVLDSTALNYEVNPTFNLTVQVTDTGDPQISNSATVTIHLNNVNETPVANPAGPFSVTENSAAGTAVGSVTASDPDAGDTLTYSIVSGNTNGAFSINPSTGAITVANSAAVDYETTPTFNLVIKVTDSGALSATTSVTVSLINVDDTSPAYQFQNLSNLVQNLQSSGDLTAVQAATLQAQLDAAKKQYDKGNIQAAENKLTQFISTVKSYISTGVLTQAEGQPLIDAANLLIATI